MSSGYLVLICNAAGIELIKRFESLRLEPYRCPAGKWTVGWGHVLSAPGGGITEAQAERLLEHDVERAEEAISDLVEVDLDENAFAALASFVFNVGRGAFLESTLLRKLNDGDYWGAHAEFDRWIHCRGVVLPGLVERRRAEAELFARPVMDEPE